MTTQQLTLDDAQRQWHIARLSRSLARWRAQGTDRLCPEEYQGFCETLAHLEAGGAYTVRTFDPTAHILDRPSPMLPVGKVLAGISKRSIGMMDRMRRGIQ
jgi:hypothetical protein